MRITKSRSEVRKYETIDGLRGFLAIGVFIHHSSIWYNYIHIGVWEAPDSTIYNQAGQTSVCFFFMITSFLFVSKLITSEANITWKKFFIARALRLMPMYYFSVFIILVTVLCVTSWKLNVGIFDFITSISRWLLFGIATVGSINNVEYTNIINAGIVWTLPFEWLFYFSLPILGLILLKNKPALLYIVISIIFSGIVLYYLPQSQKHYIHAFLIGAIAPFIIKYSKIFRNASPILITLLIVLCIILIGQFRTVESIICKLLIGIIFTCIAVGNSIFGTLKNSTIKLLGDISYSTYLIHGIILFYVFYCGFGIEAAKGLGVIEFWVIIFFTTPLVVIISYLTFNYIEKPALEYSKKMFSK